MSYMLHTQYHTALFSLAVFNVCVAACVARNNAKQQQASSLGNFSKDMQCNAMQQHHSDLLRPVDCCVQLCIALAYMHTDRAS
eukprot:14717-Heterococcus_DN1.PRE.1